jgi:hypothetical protein
LIHVHDNAFQGRFQLHMSLGRQALVSYTFAKSSDLSSSDSGSPTGLNATFAQSVEKEPAAVVELGGSTDWNVEGSTSLPNQSVTVTPADLPRTPPAVVALTLFASVPSAVRTFVPGQ